MVALAELDEERIGWLSWYLITLKLNQAVGTGLQNAQSGQTPTTSRSIEAPPPLITPENQIKEEEEAGRAKSPEPEWVIGIKEKLYQAQNDNVAGMWAKLSIYQIPQCLRENDDKAYIPQTVSLGPYHHGKLSNMDRHKWRALHHALKRGNQRVELYLDAVGKVEERTRACYEGPICMSSNEFVEMMVLDACFVLEIFLGAEYGFKDLGYSRNDPVFAMRGTQQYSVKRDMIMLENQIPFFILETLYGLQYGPPDCRAEVARLALRFFHPLIPTDAPLKAFDPLITNKHHLHCLEVFRRSLLGIQTDRKPVAYERRHCLGVFRRSLLAIQPDPKSRSHASRVADKRRQQLIHCVTELKDSGIKFKKHKTDRFWDIKFDNGILKIPRLLIDDGTKSLFLNLIAFEQCHLYCTNHITSYVIFMDNLIDSTADVSYLHHCGIIENWLGSDAEVAELFNRLCQEVVFDINNSSLSQLSKQVNIYYEKKWNAWRASLKHRYFNNPWSIISVFAAVVLLGLTLAQTFYTVYAYYMPRS